jgi:uncharacterized protein
MIYLLSILLVLFNACCLALNFFALPGNWIMLTFTAAFAWWRWEDGIFSIYTLIVAVLLAIGGEIIEFFSGMGGARKAGAGWVGSIAAIGGAFVGAIAGTILIPILFIGTLVGTCCGAALATLLIEHLSGKNMDHSFKSGLGAGFGVFVGTTTKFLLGVVIWLIIAIALFMP